MNGFQIFLCVLAGIIALFVLILSIPVHVSFSYRDKIFLSVRYLFLKFDILPIDPNKPKKEKAPKPPKEEKPPAETAEAKEKKPNPILEMVKANGFDGMMVVLQNLAHVFGLYGGKLFRSVVFDEVDIYITVGTGDSAATAIKYGKVCQAVYPFVAFLCANNVVKKYAAEVQPDFLANHGEGEVNLDFHLVVRKILNATIGMVVRLIFKVVLKFFMGAKKNKSAAAETQSGAETQNAV